MYYTHLKWVCARVSTPIFVRTNMYRLSGQSSQLKMTPNSNFYLRVPNRIWELGARECLMSLRAHISKDKCTYEAWWMEASLGCRLWQWSSFPQKGFLDLTRCEGFFFTRERILWSSTLVICVAAFSSVYRVFFNSNVVYGGKITKIVTVQILTEPIVNYTKTFHFLHI